MWTVGVLFVFLQSIGLIINHVGVKPFRFLLWWVFLCQCILWAMILGVLGGSGAGDANEMVCYAHVVANVVVANFVHYKLLSVIGQLDDC